MTRLRASARLGRRLAAIVALAIVVAAAVDLAPAAAADVRAATPDLSFTSAATYAVQPDKARVHVTLGATAVSHTQDTITRRFYFSSAYVTILPGTSDFAATSGSKALVVHVVKRTKDYVLLSVDFDRRLYSGQTYAFRLQFDLVDAGGPPTRDVRIGTSLVAFPVWAFATASTPGSSVRVILPAGFQPEPGSGDFPPPATTSSGEVVYESGPLSSPLDFYAYLMADRPGAFAQTVVETTVGGRPATVIVKAWADDPAWGKQVAGLFRRALPVLGTLIGLPYPSRSSDLTVEEAVSRSLGGYSGLFDPRQGRIQVAYYAEPFVVLHEAAHVWFNSDIASDRWIDEAFASWYAEQAAKQLGIKVSPAPLTAAMQRSRIQLNDWGAVGAEDQGVEDYAYAATLTLAGLIAQRAGPDALAAIWKAAANREAPYQPIHAAGLAPEVSNLGAPDWRVLLDLLEERTGRSFTDLWRQWVVRTADAPLLDARAEARDTYRATVAQAGTWELPVAIRAALGAWQFEDATQLLAESAQVLALRDEVQQRAKSDGLTPPSTLRRLFESPGGLGAAAQEGQNELVALSAIEAARAAQAEHGGSGVAGDVGLIGRNPAVQLADSATAFAAGDLGLAVSDADLARNTWAGAGGVGQARLLIVVGASIVVVTFLLAAVWLSRRRRREATEVVYSVPGGAARAGVAGVAGGADGRAEPASPRPADQGPRPVATGNPSVAAPGPSGPAGPYATLAPGPRGPATRDPAVPAAVDAQQGGTSRP